MLFDAFWMFCMLLLVVLLMLLFAPVPAESALGKTKSARDIFFVSQRRRHGAAKRPTRPKMFDLYRESEKHKIPKRP